jgi:hypothetical protein
MHAIYETLRDSKKNAKLALLILICNIIVRAYISQEMRTCKQIEGILFTDSLLYV